MYFYLIGLIKITPIKPQFKEEEPYDDQMIEDEIYAGNYTPHDIFNIDMPLINFNIETNQDLFVRDEKEMMTKIILDVFSGIFNSFNIFIINYLGDLTRTVSIF